MKKMAVDTNVILRYLVGDVSEQMREATKLFRRAEKGQVRLLLLPIVVAEVCYVLTGFYEKSDSEVAEMMESLLAPSWWELEHGDAMRGMWGWYREGRHFVDSYLLAIARHEGVEVVSFDKKLMKRAE